MNTAQQKTKVIVIGSLHSQHLRAPKYGLKELEAILRNLKPDAVLTEIPPDRFPLAKKQFETTGTITEERVIQYPEFTKVVFPLWKIMKFDLFPVSAWTEKMADEREKKLTAIGRDPKRADEWNRYLQARKETSEKFERAGLEFSPEWIHSDRFDDILETELSVFSELFNDDLGAGGWENINRAHYALIEEVLDRPEIAGKKVVIIFGSGHKGWLQRHLKLRTDIELISLLDALS